MPVKKKSVLAGKAGEIERSKYRYPGIVYLDDEDITADPQENDVLYIPVPFYG